MTGNTRATETSVKSKLWLSSLVAMLSILVTLAIYTPHLIYFSQREFFSGYFLQLIQLPLLYSSLVVSAVLIVLVFVPQFILRYFASMLLVVAILLWLHVDFFTLSYGILDGTELQFSEFDTRGWIEVAVLVVALLLAVILQRVFNKNLPFIVLLLLLGQLALVTLSVVQEPQDKQQVQAVDAEFHRYSTDKNVLLIILDTFGAEYFQTLLKSNPELADEYPGFVSYTDAISNYPATRGSMPSILSGKMIPENVKLGQYVRNDIQQNGLPKQFEKKGYLVSLISSTTWLKGIYPKRYISELTVAPETMKKYHAFQLFDYALFRSSLHWLKPQVFNQGQWLLSQRISEQAEIPNTPAERGLMLIDDLVSNAVATDQQPRFKVLHLTIPHPEYVYDKVCEKSPDINQWPVDRKMLEQSQCALNKLTDYLDQLKALNIYDNSLIVVASDHGARVFNDRYHTGFPSQFEMKSSGIMFMIKGVNQRQTFKQTAQPFSLIKLYSALMDDDLHSTEYSDLVDNNRLFYAYENWYSRAKGALPDAPIYQVSPNYADPASWQLQGYGINRCEPSSMPLEMRFETTQREGYCATFGFQKPDPKGGGTWTKGFDSRIVFNLVKSDIKEQGKHTIKVRFKSQSSRLQSNEDLMVLLNGELLITHPVERNAEQMIELSFSGDLLLENDNIIQLKLTDDGYQDKLKFIQGSMVPGIKIQSIKLE